MNGLKLKKLLFASIAVGLLVVFGIMIFLGKDQVIAAVLGTDLRLLSIAMAFEMMSVVALTYRWQVVVHEGGFKISDWKLFQISLSSITFSNLTPSVKTGGELASALEKITSYKPKPKPARMRRRRRGPSPADNTLKSFYIAEPMKASGKKAVVEIFMSHPLPEKRIKNLEEIEV